MLSVSKLKPQTFAALLNLVYDGLADDLSHPLVSDGAAVSRHFMILSSLRLISQLAKSRKQ
jgi:hypothetical protein